MGDPNLGIYVVSAVHGKNLCVQVLHVLCRVVQYDELPVRHNENKINVGTAPGIILCDAGSAYTARGGKSTAVHMT